MQRFEEPVQNLRGDVLTLCPMQVLVAGTNTPATIFADAAGQTVITSPSTDKTGTFAFYAPNGRYDIYAIVNGQRLGHKLDYLLYDPADAYGDAPLTQSQAASPSGASRLGYGQRTVENKLGDVVSVKDFGAKGDGITDDTAAIQTAINAASKVFVPAGVVFVVDQITVPSNRTLVIDGKLLRKPNVASDTQMIVNASGAVGDSNIFITGSGELDGNAANQTGDRQGLIRFQKPTDCIISVGKVGNNKYTNINPSAEGFGCIALVDATRCKVQDIYLSLWQREGIYVTGAAVECTVRRIHALGDGVNSWSAVQVSGIGATANKILDITADNCGASSVGCDSTYSQVDNIISRNNQFSNGVNFGHTGKPATGTRGSNITVINAGAGATSGTTHCGVQVGGASSLVDLTNITVNGAYNHCIQISDGSTDVQVGGKTRLMGSLHGCGINCFGANYIRISGVKATNNSDYGINLNAANDWHVDDCDLRGNGVNLTAGTVSGFSCTGLRGRATNSPGSDDPIRGTQATGSVAAGGTVSISNKNIFGAYTRVELEPRDSATKAGQPYISAWNTGGVVVTFVQATAGGTLGFAIE